MAAHVCLIAAIGHRGQLGLGGKIPWKDGEDLRWFRETTYGHVVVMGSRTFDVVGELEGRTTIRLHNGEAMACSGGAYWPVPIEPKRMSLYFPDRIIFIAGGAVTYRTWMPYVRRFFITRADYDGPADAFMPPLWRDEVSPPWLHERETENVKSLRT